MKSLQQDFMQLFEALAHDAAPEGATVAANSFADHDQIDLVPSNPCAARIRAILPRSQAQGVTLVVGKGTIFEIPENGGRYTEHHTAIEEAAALSKAVVGGRFTERVRTDSKNLVISSKGIIDVPPAVTARWRRLLTNPFRRTYVKHFHYEPY